MTYKKFLFSQLFMNYIESNSTKYQELEYDLIYSEVLNHEDLFRKSNYNVDVESEYDCIVNYIKNEL
tara:strand:- start:22 stop:222 length:201 start_codon:yes stop_codon:yes gene_type:complete